MYVKSPKDFDDRYVFLWLFLTESFDLVNVNAKFRVQSDNLLFDLVFCCVIDTPQLFYVQRNKQPVVLVAKIVGGILVMVENNIADNMLNSFDETFKLKNVVHRPGTLQNVGFNTIQHKDFSCATDGDDKLFALEPAPLAC